PRAAAPCCRRTRARCGPRACTTRPASAARPASGSARATRAAAAGPPAAAPRPGRPSAPRGARSLASLTGALLDPGEDLQDVVLGEVRPAHRHAVEARLGAQPEDQTAGPRVAGHHRG